ncbi:hypothetical protein COV93_06030 [Candidatus Woesearchaeota archaeon CG11_big_fil_rev_8_21_14_0_20_43_8]|nr:MAG: hypothetical protein COV93_06030 [Candidatus Woesearchaeota archaeon CG11_big_fil_rev_8_21_14_0_20_43_8]
MDFPANCDVISVGVFYGMQPSFLLKKGDDLAKSLGEKGVLMIQTGMPEALFTQHLLLGDLSKLSNWGWFDNKMLLDNYFKYKETIFIDNEFITFASQSFDRIDEILDKAYEMGAFNYNTFFNQQAIKVIE